MPDTRHEAATSEWLQGEHCDCPAMGIAEHAELCPWREGVEALARALPAYEAAVVGEGDRLRTALQDLVDAVVLNVNTDEMNAEVLKAQAALAGQLEEPCRTCGGCERVTDPQLVGDAEPGADWMPCPHCGRCSCKLPRSGHTLRGGQSEAQTPLQSSLGEVKGHRIAGVEYEGDGREWWLYRMDDGQIVAALTGDLGSTGLRLGEKVKVVPSAALERPKIVCIECREEGRVQMVGLRGAWTCPKHGGRGHVEVLTALPDDTAPQEELEATAWPSEEIGERLYNALAIFDVRDDSALSQIVRSAREGFERSHPDMAEGDAWAEFDVRIERYEAPGDLRRRLSTAYAAARTPQDVLGDGAERTLERLAERKAAANGYARERRELPDA